MLLLLLYMQSLCILGMKHFIYCPRKQAIDLNQICFVQLMTLHMYCTVLHIQANMVCVPDR